MAVKLSLLLCFFISLPSFAKQAAIKELMNNYLKAIHTKNAVELKKMTGTDYYKGLEKNYLSSNIKQNKKFIPYGFDIKVNKANVSKDQFWVNIKDKKKKEYSDYWYIIKKEKDNFTIIDMVHAEE